MLLSKNEKLSKHEIILLSKHENIHINNFYINIYHIIYIIIYNYIYHKVSWL